jgi:hypothetical protein
MFLQADSQVDPLHAALGQHAEAHVNRFFDRRPLRQMNLGFDAVLEFLDVDLQSGQRVGADNLVMIDHQVSHVRAVQHAAVHADAVENFLNDGFAHARPPKASKDGKFL